MIRLYDYWRSSASYRVRIALGLAGLQWETIPVDLMAGDQAAQQHLARNPQGLVPVLEIGDLQLTQSLAMIEYLNDTHDMDWVPGDAAERARVRALAHAIAIDIHPVCNLRVAKYAVEHSDGGITMEGWMKAFIGRGLTAVEAMLKGGDYCHGNGITLADICLIPQLYNADRWGIDLTDMPKIRHIRTALSDLPAIAAAHPDRWKPEE